LEVARGSNVSLRLDWSAVPMLPQARQLAEAGLVTGASERNWLACADAVSLPNGLPLAERALFCDPQTSGGLLVSCAPRCVSDVVHILQRFGCKQAAEIGEVQSRDSEALLVVEA
jgi:selenide,water dikinase